MQGVELLQNMFPAHDAGFLASALVTHDGDVQKAVEHLLGDSVEADERLARSLLSELATQWEMETKQRVPDEIRSNPSRLEAFLREQMKRRPDGTFATRARSALEATPSLQTLASRAVGGIRGFAARFTMPRPAARPIFATHLVEPMLSPLDVDRSPSQSHC